MHWTGWVVAMLGGLRAGWMTFDGLRALAVGDFVTAASGPYAGQLGPWSKLFVAVGLDPRNTGVKALFVGLGLLGLAAVVAWVLRLPWAWTAMVVMAVATLWYAPIGTATAAVQLVLLMLPALRS